MSYPKWVLNTSFVSKHIMGYFENRIGMQFLALFMIIIVFSLNSCKKLNFDRQDISTSLSKQGTSNILSAKVPKWTFAMNTASGIGGIASAAGFFMERSENRKIISNLKDINKKLDQVVGYLRELDYKIDNLTKQNELILSELDSLPKRIQSIVSEEVTYGELRNRYSRIRAKWNRFLLLPRKEKKRYRIHTRGWDELSDDLTFLFEYENRISKCFELIGYAEFAVFASKGGGIPEISSLVNSKHDLIKKLRKGLELNLDTDCQKLLAGLNNSNYINDHNFSENLVSLDSLAFIPQNDRPTEYMHYWDVCHEKCHHAGGGRSGERCWQVCKTHNENRPDKSGIAFNRRKVGHINLTKKLITQLRTTVGYCAEIRDLEITYANYYILVLNYGEGVTKVLVLAPSPSENHPTVFVTY